MGTPLEGTICGLQLVEQRLKVRDRQLLLVAPRSVDDVIELYIGADNNTAGVSQKYLLAFTWPACSLSHSSLRNKSFVAVQDTQDPYWCRAWPSAVALAELILEQPALVKGKQVLELGCGLGIAGLSAALAGAGQQTQSKSSDINYVTSRLLHLTHQVLNFAQHCQLQKVHHAGAQHVVMTDRDELALEFALRSAEASGLHTNSRSAGTDFQAASADSRQVNTAAIS